ncbi:hypothetical protein [Methylobacterium soli]|uniref:Uncharacterized protein n=1 Tax=Methylobacterium soli TaxID=553447 RepID=A0A6L3SYX1_9HYPH|nr:hypothetical protein [Methylobacterium soli]KAB1079323.1 hypothetical protein F6X53_10975 [Methylobacterium soli]GJE42975.1 hypothetical protein AEGHOMDF_2151 [Methylobacterium soli]
MTAQLTQQQQMQQLPTSDSRLSALETRVEGIVGTLQSVASAVTGLSDKLDRRGQTPWAVIWSAVGVGMTVLTVVGGLAFWPVTTGMSDLKAALLMMQERADKRVEALAKTQVTRDEHEVHWRMEERLYDFQRDRISRVEGRIEKRLDRLEADKFKTRD